MKFTTRFLILLVKIILCIKLHCKKYFKLKHISYKILAGFRPAVAGLSTSSFSLLLSSLELSDTKVYEPYTRALLGAASHFCEVVVLKFEAVDRATRPPNLCPQTPQPQTLTAARKVDVRLHGKGNSNSHGARPVHLIITMIKWIRTSRLSLKRTLSHSGGTLVIEAADRAPPPAPQPLPPDPSTPNPQLKA